MNECYIIEIMVFLTTIYAYFLIYAKKSYFFSLFFSNTPKLGSNTPKLGSDTPKLGSNTPKLGSNTPKLGSDTPKLGSKSLNLD